MKFKRQNLGLTFGDSRTQVRWQPEILQTKNQGKSDPGSEFGSSTHLKRFISTCKPQSPVKNDVELDSGVITPALYKMPYSGGYA